MIVALAVCGLASPAAATAAPTWLPAFPLDLGSHDVAMAPDGTVVVAGLVTVDGAARLAARVRPPGGPFGAPQVLGSGGLRGIDHGADGTVAVVWREEEKLKIAFLRPGAAAFEGAVALPMAAGEKAMLQPTIAVSVDGHGRAHVLWVRDGAADALVVSTVSAAGVASDPEVLQTASGFDSFSDLAIEAGPDGEAVAAWHKVICSNHEAAGLDVSAPRLLDLQIPASGVTGAPMAFSVRPVDVWSDVTSTTWDFGDGGTAAGAAAEHTYASAGDRTVTVQATDALGNSSMATGATALRSSAA